MARLGLIFLIWWWAGPPEPRNVRGGDPSVPVWQPADRISLEQPIWRAAVY